MTTLRTWREKGGFLRRAVPKMAPRRMGRVAPLKMNLRFSNQRSVELNMSSLGRSPRFPRPAPHANVKQKMIVNVIFLSIKAMH